MIGTRKRTAASNQTIHRGALVFRVIGQKLSVGATRRILIASVRCSEEPSRRPPKCRPLSRGASGPSARTIHPRLFVKGPRSLQAFVAVWSEVSYRARIGRDPSGVMRRLAAGLLGAVSSAWPLITVKASDHVGADAVQLHRVRGVNERQRVDLFPADKRRQVPDESPWPLRVGGQVLERRDIVRMLLDEPIEVEEAPRDDECRRLGWSDRRTVPAIGVRDDHPWSGQRMAPACRQRDRE